MNRKRLMTTIIVLAVILILVLYYIRIHNLEHNLIQGPEIDRTSYSFTNEDGKELRIDSSEDVICITVDSVIYKVDRKNLCDILSKYRYTKSMGNSDIYFTNQYAIKISISDKSGPKHILLGEDDTIWYESAGEGEYNILNGKELINEIRALANTSEIVEF